MSELALIPDKKLFSKQYLLMFTISLNLIIIALILQITVPLGGEVDPAQLGSILWPITGLVIFLLIVVWLPIAILWIKNLKYFIEDERITIHKGILTKMQKNIPYRAITDFTLHRSLYDRFLGISSIRIQTAGQSPQSTGYEGILAGLTDWDSLLNELRIRLRKTYKESLVSPTGVDTEVTQDVNYQIEILNELKKIREVLEK